MCLCVHTCIYHGLGVKMRGQFESQFSSTMWALRIKLRSLDLAGTLNLSSSKVYLLLIIKSYIKQCAIYIEAGFEIRNGSQYVPHTSQRKCTMVHKSSLMYTAINWTDLKVKISGSLSKKLGSRSGVRSTIHT